MKYFLVKSITYFVDPHGTPDKGSEVFSVIKIDEQDDDKGFLSLENNEEYACNEDAYYDDEEEMWVKVKDFGFGYAQDGYNHRVDTRTQIEINETDYEKYNKTLNSYKKLKGKF